MNVKTLHKVLYIEDDAETRKLVGRVLAGQYVVLEAKDPIIGIELAEETEPDIVLLDVNLPNMSGLDVASRLRTILSADTPIIALTADYSPGLREKALAAGFSGLLTKPIDIDRIHDQLRDFLNGHREELPDAEKHLREYQVELVERMESRVRELSDALYRNNHLREMLVRRQHLLEAGARVSHEITSILDLDELLNRAVDIICTEYKFYYSGIFLLNDGNTRLELHAGHGKPGAQLLKDQFSLPVDKNSMSGLAVIQKKPQLALEVEGRPSHFKNPLLPDTRSEMVLPLLFKGNALGALTVQSADLNAFTEEDGTALQSLADQIANAIQNARLIGQLDHANQELLRSKTFEAIASATGEAIHWVGNKAAPVPGSIQRVREDLLNMIAAFNYIISVKSTEKAPNPLNDMAAKIFEEAQNEKIDLIAKAKALIKMPENRRNALVSLESMLEDLQIAENSTRTILDIKEDLIGPARKRNPLPFSLTDEVARIALDMALPKGVIEAEWTEGLPKVNGDPRQIDQVFNNLIKNAWEAMAGQKNPRIKVSIKKDPDPKYLLACVRDNGPGIPAEIQEKIWVSFFTTKGNRGGTGLGLSACMEIINQNNGKIWLESAPGKGAAFYVQLPIAK
ncbi:MAG: response regulator [Anaerolineales bacterium]|nr:response regulator [Anaerolineales bacterium]